MTDMSGNPNEGALSWAVFLALDRMVLSNPDRMLADIAASPALMESNPEVRASLMSRADVLSTPQREALDTYLRRVDLSTLEAETFAGLFPNHNLLVGYRLFTPSDNDGIPLPEYAARDLAAFERISTWENDPSLAPAIRAAMPGLRSKLAGHVESARRATASGELTRGP